MKQIWTISKKELFVIFNSLIGYVLIILFLTLTGFLTWMNSGLNWDIFYNKQASLIVFFVISEYVLLWFIPGITMRAFSEENKTGTIELLLTKPVNDWQVVLGKFLSSFLLIVFIFILTIPYYITVSNLGPIDHGAVWTGYLGLLLVSAAYISIGIFTSSLFSNQIVSFLLALFLGLFFQVILPLLASRFTGVLGELLNFLSFSTHFQSISRGVIDSKDLIFFGSFIFLGLILTEANVAKKRL